VRQVEIAQPLRVDKGQPLLAAGIVHQPQQEVRIEVARQRKAQAFLFPIRIAQQVQTARANRFLDLA